MAVLRLREVARWLRAKRPLKYDAEKASTALAKDVMTMWVVHSAATAAFSAGLCVFLILVLWPWLRRYALAQPNARSSHREPTPQGGGVAVVAATLAGACFGSFNFGGPIATPLVTLFTAAVIIACIGAADDVRPLAVAPRLLLQALTVAAVIYVIPDRVRVVPVLPWWVERVLLFVAELWFVNLVNFMDGIDWMIVAEVVPITAALAIIGYLGALAPEGVALALALGGAMLGFAYFNRPTARLFLGDVGSLPVGLILGWLLLLVAAGGHLAAALIMPLYFVADTTIVLIWRLVRGESILQAHRTHFYQRATDRGFSVIDVVARVFAANLALGALAVATVVFPGKLNDAAALIVGGALVAWLLVSFTRGRK